MAEHKRWGAQPESWAIVAESGLTEDMLPVVSNPNATIARGSALRTLGKVPSRYNNSNEVVGIPSWTRMQASDRQVALWSRHMDHGICVQTRRLRAIDIDIADPEHAAQAQALVEAVTGPLPCRSRPGTGKRLLAVWCEGSLRKTDVRTMHGVIELLADGQQFVAAGTHTSGERYVWSGPGVDPLDEVPHRWPTCTLAQYEAVVAALSTLAAPNGVVESRAGVMPTLPRAAADGWGDPMPAWLAENSWTINVERDGKINIRCPFEDQHTTDSGPSATVYFPRGVGGFQQGHFRCLHAHCSGRKDDEFLEAMGLSVLSEFEPVEGADAPAETISASWQVAPFESKAPHPPLMRGPKGVILPTAENLWALLQRPDIVKVRLAYDAFRDIVVIAYEGDEAWRPIADKDYFDIRRSLEKVNVAAVGKELVRDAAMRVASDHVFDSALDWAATLQWDGVRRARHFFLRYLRVPPSQYTEALGLYLWSALGGRLTDPGCKVDMVPVLISAQGTGKTSLVETLAPIEETFAEVNLKSKEADLARLLRGKLVGEIAELRGLSSRDAEETKAWVTRRYEEWVPKFQEHTVRYPRRCVFIGTGNREFLDDETGERRWLPVRVGKTDLQALRADVTQLWAEGVALYREHGVHWAEAQKLAASEHEEFKIDDPWHPLVQQWLDSDAMDQVAGVGQTRGDQPVRVVDILMGACDLRPGQINVAHERRVGKILARLGYDKHNRRIDGVQARVWIKTAKEET